ncbi:hypothetical protein [Eremococcus coleocola]|uniref:hypothetical protein n=1 Tax=Eremococcus coleocola TaxID=88132 RepID=UPI000483F0A8|nr:hypothetical protein [Eremococcus coleocola]
MQIIICIQDRLDYNKGIDSKEWFTLPRDLDRLIHVANTWEKPIVYYSDYDFIGENDIDTVIKFSKDYCNYNFNDFLDYYSDNNLNGEIYSMYRFNEVMNDLNQLTNNYTPLDIVDKVLNGDRFNSGHEYFMIDRNRNIVSLSNEDRLRLEEMYYNEAIKTAFINSRRY